MNDRMDHDAADSPEYFFIGSPVKDHPEKAQKSNPINYVSRSNPLMLLISCPRSANELRS
jgi:hypothetical protein